MYKKFKEPDFSVKQVELRFQDGEVCIYATDAGLKRLISMCQDLIQHQREDHIHLEDYELLTDESLPGVIALFMK